MINRLRTDLVNSDFPLRRQDTQASRRSPEDSLVEENSLEKESESAGLISGLTQAPRHCEVPAAHTAHPLHWAVQGGRNDVLSRLLEIPAWRWDADRAGPGERGERPLHIAAATDNVDAFRLLFHYGANPHARQNEYYGLQPVQVAAYKGSFRVLDYLIRELRSFEGRNFIEATDLEGSTALRWAVHGGQDGCVKYLLEQGAVIDVVQTQGPQATPLHFACIEASLPMVRMMAENRPADFQRALNISDVQGCLALHRAVVLDRVELVEFLLEKGSPFDVEDKEKRTPIILAAIREAWSTLDVLLAWGADPFACTSVDARHIGHHAAIVGADIRPCRGLQTMLSQKPEYKEKLDSVDGFGYTPLQYAASYGYLEAFHGLIERGASIAARSKKDKTVLHYAAKFGQMDMVRALLDTSAGISIHNAMDHKGISALHVAALYGHHDVAELLLSKGAFCFRDDSGKTALHNAAAHNHHHIMGSILTYFSFVLDAADKNGSTALHLAATNDAAETVRYLLDIGAKIKEDAYGRTPMDWAILHKNERAALAFVTSRNNWKSIIIQPSIEYGSVVLGLIAHLPDVMTKCLDRCLKKRNSNQPGYSYISYDFSILHPLEHSEKVPARYREPMRAMKLMASLRRSDLLAHPVCTAFLERKWVTYGMYCSGFIMASNLICVALLSYVMMSAVESNLRPYLLRKSYRNVELNSPLYLNQTDFEDLQKRAFTDAERFESDASLGILGLSLAVMFLKELAEQRSQGYRYFLRWMNYTGILLFMSCGGFMYCFCQDNWLKEIGPYTYQLGAVAIFLAWFNLLRLCRPFGTFGIYSFMFFCTLNTFIRVSLFFFLLTAAFTATFSTLFQSYIFPNITAFYQRNPDLNADKIKTPFAGVTNSALRIGAMTVGDLEANNDFIYPLMDGMLEYPLLSFLFYAIFLMLMPILLHNLLTGLAIGDLATIQANAASLRLEMQVYLHESLEKLFPSRYLQKLQEQSKSHRVYPGARLDFRTWLARWLQSGGIRQPIFTGNLGDLDDREGLSRTSETQESLKKLNKRLKQQDVDLSELKTMVLQLLSRSDQASAVADDNDEGSAFAASSVKESVPRRPSERIREKRKAKARLLRNRRRFANQNPLSMSSRYD
ncbi:Transient receptor potential cation channel subfamily A member 1 [Hypsibius exemplaris]|uniref:Transient receptor potential cation channel subfamily A member 1 n=1 Tax=Hypsibius exemplaris TaxID=2072580 RepID=A0A1W0WGB6_HYPEX|nr:Transient receptor potential cation channel subfamily A member 1 [Hypsibius exemplaris]